jgi:hypothetical protein
MNSEACPDHADYDGWGAPPDPACADCLRLQEQVDD